MQLRIQSSKFKVQNFRSGFTLIELIITGIFIGMVATLAIATLRPDLQLSKATDARRKADLVSIQSALDIYYNDHSCYPQDMAFGDTFQDESDQGTVVYMKKVPEDPDCGNIPNSCYIYQATGSCPQWYVLYANLSKASSSGSACALNSLTNCKPQDYLSSLSCTYGGTVDCSVIASSTLGFVTPTPTVSGPINTPTITPTAGPTLTPTTTPSPTIGPSPTITPTIPPSPTPTIIPGSSFTIAGYIYKDLNSNGTKESNEIYITREYIMLYQNSSLKYRVRGDTSGNFTFTGVTSGYYTFRMTTYSVTSPMQIGVGPNKTNVGVGVN